MFAFIHWLKAQLIFVLTCVRLLSVSLNSCRNFAFYVNISYRCIYYNSGEKKGIFNQQ